MSDIEKIRHSFAHLLARAVLELYPKANFGMGPAIENGFYYDFDFTKGISDADLPRLEKKIKHLIKQNLPIKKDEISKETARKLFTDNPYKLEIVSDLIKNGKKNLTTYSVDGFIDLCEGPHVERTGKLNPKAFKLTSVAGAYWKGSEKNKMLTRIYGVAFESEDELAQHLERVEEAKKYDHRKLGKELGIFHIDETVGRGLPLWLPRGAALRQALERFIIDEETKRGYQRTYSPVIGNVNLYKMSGHWDHYKDEMYPPIKVDGDDFVLRPMTCPHQFMVYKAEPKSYRDLPVRLAELAEMYRKEKSGELTGLQRVMGFTLSDAHIICRREQLEEEFIATLDFVMENLKKLGLFEASWVRASLRDKDNEKYIKNDKLWNESEEMLLRILKGAGFQYKIGEGDAAFYGPKADIQIKNIHGKEETIITIQIDLVSAKKFDLTFKNEKGEDERPVIIHRSSIGCIERTVAFLLEHHRGALPTWMAPVQVALLSVNDAVLDYLSSIDSALKEAGIRTETFISNDTVGKKIREAELQKIPYILVVGEKEKKISKISVRIRGEKKIIEMELPGFIDQLLGEIKEYKA